MEWSGTRTKASHRSAGRWRWSKAHACYLHRALPTWETARDLGGLAVGLRIFGATVAALLALYALRRYRKDQLRRGEMLVVAIVVAGLAVAAAAPNLLDPVLSALGFEPGQERRIIGLLVISNVLHVRAPVPWLVAGRPTLERGRRPRRLPGAETARGVGLAAAGATRARWSSPPTTRPRTSPPCSARCRTMCSGSPSSRSWSPTAAPTEPKRSPAGSAPPSSGATCGAARAPRSGSVTRPRCEPELASPSRSTPTASTIPRRCRPVRATTARRRGRHGAGIAGAGLVRRSSRGARSLGVKVFARLLSALGRTKITDPSTGYRAMTAETLRKLDLKQDQFYVSEVILEAARKGFTRRRGSDHVAAPGLGSEQEAGHRALRVGIQQGDRPDLAPLTRSRYSRTATTAVATRFGGSGCRE